MSRILLVGLFAVLTIAKGDTALGAIGFAHDHGGLDAILLAAYDSLKAAVIASFGVFIAIRPSSKRASREPIAFAACFGAIASLVVLQDPERTGATAYVLVGDVVTVVACLWQLAAVLFLGRCFGILPEARGLVTRGPYRLVRHPVYLGELGACAGLVVAAPSVWNLVAAGAFAACQTVRMRLEEAALTAEFPQYAAYAARTPRLVPRLARPVRAAPALGTTQTGR